MANIHDTISEVEKLNPELARQIKKYVKEHSYGLVYENNLPEAVRLYKKERCVGDTVNILPPRGQQETEENSVPWVIREIEDGVATIVHEDETRDVPVEDLVPLVSYKDVIYPGLKEIDRVERGNPDDPYHMVINAENYHALEALTYAYAGKVDCIYIDPPYNKPNAKDWKYNCNYIDANDQYRHSKWLSFMERRLKLAKQLLNPNESVLIVTIDEQEYTRLGLLLEQIFPEASIQMVSSCIMPGGVSRENEFGRSDEYIYFVKLGTSAPVALQLSDEWLGGVKNTSRSKVHWEGLLRTGTNNMRSDRPNLFYPVFVSTDGKRFLGTGEPLNLTEDRLSYTSPEGTVAIWPIHTDMSEGCWRISRETLLELYENHVVRLGGFTSRGMAINYLKRGEYAKVLNGTYRIKGIKEDNSYDLDDGEYKPSFIPSTQWTIASHDASRHGSGMLRKIFGDKVFSFPKSLYAVHDTIRFFVANKPNALIVDFFSGSGTTLHAVNLLNAEDGGHRRCICVTNNEVSESEEKRFTEAGLRPSDPEWEKYGIANYVTWPRTKCTIEGVNVNGEPLKGNYLGSDIPMSDGFKANAIFCELTYESAWPIRLDNAFDAIAPILWMQAGCRGPIIKRIGKSYATTDFYGVLFDYNQASKFCDAVKSKGIKTVFIVTDDQRRFSNMCRRLPGVEVHRLYETYLRTFEICGEGGLD